MTIVVAVACPEGLVLAADSRSSMFGERGGRVATDYTQKVFSIGDRFGVVTFGYAFVDGNTIAGLMEEFEAQTKPPEDIDEAVERLRDYFQDRLEKHFEALPHDKPPEGADALGFMVGGYDDKGVGRIKLLYLPTKTIHDGSSTAARECGAHWDGETQVLSRLIKGWDAASIDISKWPQEQTDALQGAEYLTPFGRMALQDAVDFATFAIRTTIDMQRFSDGTVGSPGSFPTCGGTAELVAINRRGLQWLQETKLRATVVRGEPLQ
jgi:20S proteasome alpha/beta subunit